MLNRFCEPAEIAAAIAYLCSRVDGGFLGMTAEGFGEDVRFAGLDQQPS